MFRSEPGGRIFTWLPILESLVAHKATLKSLTIEGLWVDHLGGLANNPLLKQLTALESFTLPRAMVERGLPEEFGNCLPPNLRRIAMKFGFESFKQFSDAAASWFRVLLKMAMSYNVPITSVYIHQELRVEEVERDEARDGRIPVDGVGVCQGHVLFLCFTANFFAAVGSTRPTGNGV